MNTIVFYSTKNHLNNNDIYAMLKDLETDFPHQIVGVYIDGDESLSETYKNDIPFLQIGPYKLRYPFTEQDLRITLGAAADRYNAKSQTEGENFKDRFNRGHAFTGTDKASLWLSKNYIWLINLLVTIYVGLPFLSPALMKNGNSTAARIIYTIYSPLCHQLAYRSWFLYGEQPYYPRELAGVPVEITYESLVNRSGLDIAEARKFIGNETVGYKVALCERDVAIYGAMLLFGIIFALSDRKVAHIPWYIWILFGLLPIAVDGFSQLAIVFQNIWPDLTIYRESTPLLRTLTGGLFGFLTAWYIYPLIEEAMIDNRNLLLTKLAVSTKSLTGTM